MKPQPDPTLHLRFVRGSLSGAMAVFLSSCFATSPAEPPPEVDVPITIELIAPRQPVVIEPSSLETARQVAEAVKQRREILARLKKERSGPRSFPLDNEELRALEPVFEQGRKLSQGVHLTLRVTNVSKEAVSLYYGPDMSSNELHVVGPGAVFLRYDGPITADLKIPPATKIAPGESKDFQIRELRSGGRELDRWLITSPGTYTVSLKFMTRIPGKPAGPGNGPVVPRLHTGPPIHLTSNKVTFKVRSASH